MKAIIKIAIAEDHGLLRQGLITLLKAYKHIQVVFEVGNGKEAIDLLKENKIDILLLDIEMPGMKGQEVLAKVKARYPAVHVIMVSAYYQKDYILECFKLGAKAFLPKDDKIEKVVEAIECVFEKGIYTDSHVATILADELHNANKKRPAKTDLSTTELVVLKLMCEGVSRKMAADKLGVKKETINFHMGNIMRKTNTATVAMLVSYAIQNKLYVPTRME